MAEPVEPLVDSERWAAVSAGATTAAAVNVAREVAQRLRDPGRVAARAAAAMLQTAFPASLRWRSHEVEQGAAGVARALWLAGAALDDDTLRGLAVEAMAAVYRRPVPQRGIDTPTFCHGVAGLLQITLRFAHDTGHPLFTEAAVELVAQLLGQYEPERPLGYANLEPGGTRVDQPGLLDGAPGVVLPLLAAATDVPPRWDRLFLLA